jgi:hypothetical protein
MGRMAPKWDGAATFKVVAPENPGHLYTQQSEPLLR